MPKSYGQTQKGKADAWLRRNATGKYISVRRAANEVGVSPQAFRSAMRELALNKIIVVRKWDSGKNTRWWIDLPEWKKYKNPPPTDPVEGKKKVEAFLNSL